MNPKIKEFLLELGFDYGFLSDDMHHIFENNNCIITFDDRYEFIAIDNHIGEYTIDYKDINFDNQDKSEFDKTKEKHIELMKERKNA